MRPFDPTGFHKAGYDVGYDEGVAAGRAYESGRIEKDIEVHVIGKFDLPNDVKDALKSVINKTV